MLDSPFFPLLNLGVSENRGPKYSTLNSRILIIRTPKQGTPNFRKLPLSEGFDPAPLRWGSPPSSTMHCLRTRSPPTQEPWGLGFQDFWLMSAGFRAYFRVQGFLVGGFRV